MKLPDKKFSLKTTVLAVLAIFIAAAIIAIVCIIYREGKPSGG